MEGRAPMKTHINLVAIGHMDSGKSTVLGHLLYLCGEVDTNAIEKLEKSACEMGRSSFKYAWLLDQGRAERERGITINCTSRWKLETMSYHCTIIDTPGYKKYIKNMIRGTSQADLAILVVSASKGEFEIGFSKEGQTREHALLAFTFGVKQMICCVNKMDTTDWSQERYTEIVKEVSAYLKPVGYNPDKTPFIPISAWHGDNLMEKSSSMPWYTGPCLLDAINLITPPKRHPEKPLRLPVREVYRITGVGTVLLGRVESGTLRPGMFVNTTCAESERNSQYISRGVNSVEMHNVDLPEANPGDCVGLNVPQLSRWLIYKGSVVSDSSNHPAEICSSFIAQIYVLDHPTQIKAGYTPVLFCHTAHVPCRVDKLLSTIDRHTGAVIEEEPKFIKKRDCALVQMSPQKEICMETFAEYPQLGRFAIRDMSLTIAVGVIRRVEVRGRKAVRAKTSY